ncbi:hypothetical protein STENM327S_00291 [Streptomyces tendae]
MNSTRKAPRHGRRSPWTARSEPGSAETFYRRGLLDTVLSASHADPARSVLDLTEAPDPRDVSHFAGMGLDAADIDVASLPLRLPSPAMEGFMTSLEAVTSVLAERAAELGVQIGAGTARYGFGTARRPRHGHRRRPGVPGPLPGGL